MHVNDPCNRLMRFLGYREAWTRYVTYGQSRSSDNGYPLILMVNKTKN